MCCWENLTTKTWSCNPPLIHLVWKQQKYLMALQLCKFRAIWSWKLWTECFYFIKFKTVTVALTRLFIKRLISKCQQESLTLLLWHFFHLSFFESPTKLTIFFIWCRKLFTFPFLHDRRGPKHTTETSVDVILHSPSLSSCMWMVQHMFKASDRVTGWPLRAHNRLRWLDWGLAKSAVRPLEEAECMNPE